jgi:tetratricopeptide (TPR) repeat protein
VTFFCKVVTPGEPALTTGARASVTNKVGEAMAPAPGKNASGGFCSGAGAAPVFLLAIALAACAPERREPPAEVAVDAAVTPADPRDAGAGPTREPARQFWSAYLEAQVGGDVAAARRGYEEVLARADEDPTAAARAAVELAELEVLEGNRRRALELLARAQSLAPDDARVADVAGALSARLAATPAGRSDVRGPAPGTALPGLDDAAQAKWRAAEELLLAAHRLRMKPVLEALSGSVRRKERATEAAVRAYREVAALGGLATVAAEFRAGTLYHDLAVELVFDLPPELDPGVAARLRRTLRASAVSYLRRAVAAYERALEAPATGPEVDPWRVAAEASARAARELLAGAQR